MFRLTALIKHLSVHPLLLAGCMALAPAVPAVLRSLPAQAEPVVLSRQSFVADAVARSGPAVVTLETARTVKRTSLPGLPPGVLQDPSFDASFNPLERGRRSHGCSAVKAVA